MEGTCRLCSKSGDLQLSHIVPAFVYRWLKDTSGTGFLRFGKNPNLREQDGLKDYWLCSDCEERFNPWETAFADEAFRTIVDSGARRVQYKNWMLKFVVSLTWRILSYIREVGRLDHFTPDMTDEANRALERWGSFLLGKEEHPGPYEQHMLIVDEIASHSGGELPTNINRYLLRSVDIDVVASKAEAFVYVKLPYIILVGFIHMLPRRKWKGTKLHVKKGVAGASRTEVPRAFGEYIMGQARKLQRFEENISEKQKGKIAESYNKNADSILNTGSFKAMDADVRLFGLDAFEDGND